MGIGYSLLGLNSYTRRKWSLSCLVDVMETISCDHLSLHKSHPKTLNFASSFGCIFVQSISSGYYLSCVACNIWLLASVCWIVIAALIIAIKKRREAKRLICYRKKLETRMTVIQFLIHKRQRMMKTMGW